MNYSGDNFESLVKMIATVASQAALMTVEKKNEQERKERQKVKLRNTRLLLEKYRMFNEHIDNATFKVEQIKSAEAINWLNEMYDPNNKADQIVESIKNSAVKTRIIVAHINKMIKIYESYCKSDDSPKMKRRFEALYGRYISEKRVRYEKVAEKWNVDVRTIQADVNEAINEFSGLLFGVDWLDKYENFLQ